MTRDRVRQPELPVPYTLIEWNRVCSLLQSTDLAEQEECLNYLMMWCSRMADETPIAISCTVMCLQSTIKEHRMTHPRELHELKLLISITVIRFINYISEARRAKTAQSIYDCCAQAGIPRWVVEIRHDASHTQLPCLTTLKRALDLCMAYLQREFWSKPIHEGITAAAAEGEISEEDAASNAAAIKLRKDIEKAIEQFVRWRQKNMHATEWSTVAPLNALHKHMRSDVDTFMSILTATGTMILFPTQAERFGTEITTDWEIPYEVKLVWTPVFASILEADLMSSFVFHLFERKIAASREDNKQVEYQAASWINYILKKALEPERDAFKEHEWSTILIKMIEAPDGFSTATSERVMSKVPSMDKKFRRQARKIMNISAGEPQSAESLDETTSPESKIYTLADLEALMNKRNSKKVSREKIGLFREMDMSEERAPVQMGVAAGQNFETISLVLDDDWLELADAEWSEGHGSQLMETFDEVLDESVMDD